VALGWRLPDDSRAKVTYDARVVAYEADKDRWLVVLERLHDEAGFDALRDLPAETRDLIRALAGRWAYVPDDARHGVTLPLKYETLTGRGPARFFYAQDPRLNDNRKSR
jgi:hypothetical protein